MSDVTTQGEEMNETPAPDEKALLLQRAKMMGLRVSNNSSVETLRAKIAEAMEKASAEPEEEESMPETEPNPEAPERAQPQAVASRKLTKQERRQQLRADALKLVRVRITNLDPKKKDLPGEIFTVANRFIGTVRRYVPFGEQTDKGWHVEKVIYDMMAARKFLHIRVTKDKRNGQPVVKTSFEREFSLEVLPQLTQKELTELRVAQAAAAGEVD